jgi:Kef-type K+ transport system membrane component KefB
VLARILQESGLAKERVGVLSLVCAAVNDVAAWIVVAVVIAIASASGPGHAVVSLLLGVVFVAVMLLVVRPLLARWGEPPVWAVLAIAVLSAWIGEQIGVHAIIGGFVAGLVMPRRPDWQRALADRIGGVVGALLLPIFFAVVGIATRVDQFTWAGLALLAGVTVVAIVGKLGGASVAARLAGESWRDALTIGVLMNTRGITEIVILSTGLQLGLISPMVFTAMVLMALLTTAMAAPALRLVRRERAAAATG